MTTRLRVVAGGWAELSAHLFQNDGREHAAFLPATFTKRGEDLEVLARSPIIVSDSDLVGGAEAHHLEVGPEALVRVVNEAVRRGVGLIEVHNHGPEFPARFSHWDTAGFREVVPYMRSSLRGGSYAALVLGSPENVDGLVWSGEDTSPSPIDTVEVLGPNRVSLLTTHAEDLAPGAVELDEGTLAKFDRQVRAFGPRGQLELSTLRVGIAGLGGLGTVVLEELVQSGVRWFVLVDYDIVEETNLTRTALLRPGDIGKLKVEALRDRVKELAPDAHVVTVPQSLYAADALGALAGVDVIVGCTDDSGTRYALNELALRSLRPYLDLASEIHTDGEQLGVYGGRFTFTMPGSGCLLCAQAVDPRQAAAELRPASALEAEVRAGYIEGSSEPAAAVRSINDIVASLGVLELQAWATGIRPVKSQTIFDGRTGEAQRLLFRANPKCLACGEFLGRGVGEDATSRYAEFARR